MAMTTKSPELANICAKAFSSVSDMRRDGIAKLREQGYKMAMTNNGYVNRVKNTLWITESSWGFCDDDLSVGDKCALLQSGDFNRPLDIEITEINKLAWSDRLEYSFKYV